MLIQVEIGRYDRLQGKHQIRIVGKDPVCDAEELQPFSQIQIRIVQDQTDGTFDISVLRLCIRTGLCIFSFVVICIIAVISTAGKGIVAQIAEICDRIDIGKIFFCTGVGLFSVYNDSQRSGRGNDKVVFSVMLCFPVILRHFDQHEQCDGT